MRLLAVVAIAVIAVIGSPTTGTAKSELTPEVCEAILASAKISWQHIVRYGRSQITLTERLREAQSYDKEYAKLRRKKEEQMKLMANYAQIYTAFCKSTPSMKL